MKTCVCLTLFVLSVANSLAQTPEQIEFFESRIRPILAQECYSCHSTAAESEGNLFLDSRPGWQAGGNYGEAIVPGDPDESLLLQAIKHEHDDLKMPKHGAKLDDATIADFEKWIRDGAIDPRDAPPSQEQYEKETSWSAILERRAEWWALKPLAKSKFISASAKNFAEEIDRLIESEISSQGIPLADRADDKTLRRRLSYTLTGLPPRNTTKSISGNGVDHSYEALVDELLASPHYGEKWARHFMDWVRYAESYGSEGDPAIPYAWRYRDYLIRTFNDDVPWPQMIREAIAGDLLPNQRIKNGINESAIGIGQLRMVLHGFSPVDSLDEQVSFTDNQIDTVTKAFQAFTVSCARCHNHKFDAISQTDFYSLYGIFTSTHPAVIDVNVPGTGEEIRNELQRIKTDIKETLVKTWMAQFPQSQVAQTPVSQDIDSAASTENSAKLDASSRPFEFRGLSPIDAGEFSIHGDTLRVHPNGYLSSGLSQRDRAVLYTDRFTCEGGTLWFRIAGSGGVNAKYVVQNYPRTGTIHKAIELNGGKDESLTWRKLEIDFWKGDEIFLQVATAADKPAEHRADAPSWFMLTDVLITENANPPDDAIASVASPRQLVEAWETNSLSSADAEALDELIQAKKLSLDSVNSSLQRFRELESKLPMPTRVPGVIDANPKDAPLFVRGDHKQPSELVPRRFLEVLDPTPFKSSTSGRLELADRMADMKVNPLTARVIVNRLWHHVFGRGLVPSVDNFGKLGDLPSHPELLDALAQRFIDSGGSIKALLRDILLTETFQRSSDAVPIQVAKDAENRFLARFPLRRLDAESIRDSILALTGKLNTELYGESVGSSARRRSVYVNIIRNRLDPFLTTFDAPVPFSTRGKRDVTNVPAQSLTLLNDPNVIQWSRDWAKRMLEDNEQSASLRVRKMLQESLQREASDAEVNRSVTYVQTMVDEAKASQLELIQQTERMGEIGRKIDAILEPARKRLASSIKASPSDQSFGAALEKSLPVPIAEWTFDQDARDTFGKLPLKLAGAARIENGALLLDGQSMAQSESLPNSLNAKTLEAWVMLDGLAQQGGGVITVQGKDGDIFDSIVFGEQQAGHWIAGSNFFDRTESFEGPIETDAAKRPIHVAIVYDADGTVTGYRDGKPYGKPYRKAKGAVFDSETSQVLLGCRHGQPSGNRGLRGKIYRARLYDRALTSDQIAATWRILEAAITDADVLASLSESDRDEVIAMRMQEVELAKAIETFRGTANQDKPELKAWSNFAHSLINLKEFIYLR